MPARKFRPEDAIRLRQLLEQSIRSAIQEFTGAETNIRTLESSVTHDTLAPEGDLYNIRFRVEVHEKERKEHGIHMEQAIKGPD